MCLLDVPRECTHTDYTSYYMSALSRNSRTSYAHYFRVIINIISILLLISNDFNFPKIPKKLKIIKSRMSVRTLFWRTRKEQASWNPWSSLPKTSFEVIKVQIRLSTVWRTRFMSRFTYEHVCTFMFYHDFLFHSKSEKIFCIFSI